MQALATDSIEELDRRILSAPAWLAAISRVEGSRGNDHTSFATRRTPFQSVHSLVIDCVLHNLQTIHAVLRSRSDCELEDVVRMFSLLGLFVRGLGSADCTSVHGVLRQLPDHDATIVRDRSEKPAATPFVLCERWGPLDSRDVVRVPLQGETRPAIVCAINENGMIITARRKDIIVEPVNIINFLGVGFEAQLLWRFQIEVQNEKTDREIVLGRKE